MKLTNTWHNINTQPEENTASSQQKEDKTSLKPPAEVCFWAWPCFRPQRPCSTWAASWQWVMGSRGQTLAWTLLPVLLLGVTCSPHGSLVKVNKGLKVKRGQAAYLQEGDLQFHIPHQRDACKLEVVLNEPITQRVGKLLPQVMEKCASNENPSVSLAIYHVYCLMANM